MTNLERLISFLGFSPPANSAEGALQDLNLNPAGTYDSTYSVSIKTAALEIMKVLITTANFTNQQTGASTTYDRPSILARIKMLEKELGIKSSGPKITGKSVW